MLRTFSRGILFLSSPSRQSSWRKILLRLPQSWEVWEVGHAHNKRCHTEAMSFVVLLFLGFFSFCSLFCLLSCSWNNTYKKQNAIKMLDHPIFQSSSETQVQIVGRGKVGTGEKKVREKSQGPLTFLHPLFFFCFVLFCFCFFVFFIFESTSSLKLILQ